ncbi:hypothetical protein KR044_010576 [Drosophila immigrans]|nr:hypothetical protein KR044_010576 [Drosophila immigrans]
MLLNKAYKHCIVAGIVMGVALVTYAYDDRDLLMFLHVVRALQLVATAALFFAIFKKDPLHKDKLLLFWLAVTTFLEISIAICTFNYMAEYFEFYDFGDFIISLLALVAQWLAMG